MTKLPLEIAERIVEACKAGAGDAGGSLSSAFDSAMQISDVASFGPFGADGLPPELAGPGLAMALHVGKEGIALLLPESTNLLPPWYAAPDAAGNGKLQTLAQKLSHLLVPEDLAVGRSAAGAVAKLADAARAAQLAGLAGCVKLSMTGDDGSGAFYMLWPLAQPGALLPPADETESASSPGAASVAARQAASGAVPPEALPPYSKSLLGIQVPVTVRLAETKLTVDEVIHLGPGAIIQFDKSCEGLLELEAGGCRIAEGETVKVGEKFGLRITAIRLPDERLEPIGK